MSNKAPQTTDIITPDADAGLDSLLRERLKRTPDAIAYRQYDAAAGDWLAHTWAEFAADVVRWQAALAQESLEPGDRVAVMLYNCREWAAFDMAAHGLGLVVVPLYVNDRADNVGLILEDCGAKLLLVGGDKQWQALAPIEAGLKNLQRILSLQPVAPLPGGLQATPVADWLPKQGGDLAVGPQGGDAPASIVYTSGTTGRPKGVMLSHRNILANVSSILAIVPAFREDLFLSFLPLSHMLERTAGYYLPMATGATVAYARSPKLLAEDFEVLKPTAIISVPRVFERVYTKVQARLAQKPAPIRGLLNKALEVGWEHFLYTQGRGQWSPGLEVWKRLDKAIGPKVRYRIGGNLRCVIVGGAAMAPEVARFFIGAGIPMIQGYGATETAPVVTVNTLEANIPESVGIPLPGTEVRCGDNDELLTRGPCVMLGYWNNPDASAGCIDADGWFHTGDQARIDGEHVFITGRLKEIIVLSNGEKVPPADMELAITMDGLFSQLMVVGEGKPFLAALVVLDSEEYRRLAAEQGLDEAPGAAGEALEKILVQRIAARLKEFPGYAKSRRVAVVDRPWTTEDGLMTPTLKLKRPKVLARHSDEVEQLYAGH